MSGARQYDKEKKDRRRSVGGGSSPVIHQLSCSPNRLTGLPDMTSWISLLTIAAEDNS